MNSFHFVWYNFCMITKAEYEILNLMSDHKFHTYIDICNKISYKKVELSDLLFVLNNKKYIAHGLNNDYLIMAKGTTEKIEYEEQMKLSYRKNFLYPATVALLGVFVGFLLSLILKVHV